MRSYHHTSFSLGYEFKLSTNCLTVRNFFSAFCTGFKIFGRYQLETEFFLSVTRWKNVVTQKCLLKKFFLHSEAQLVGGKFWSPIFLSRIKMKRTHLRPQWRFFLSRIKLNTNTLVIYTPSTEKPLQRNQMLPCIYAVLCDCQIFQVNFIPSLVSN